MAATMNAPIDALRKPVLAVVGVLALYFAYRYVLHYYTWSEQSYGYYWVYRLPLIAHVSGGALALLVGVYQLWSGLNAESMSAHPWSGRLYVTGVLVGSLAALVLAVSSRLYGFAWAVGLVALAVSWLSITGMALLCIRRRDIKAHKQWMIRSYIVTFAFVLFRFMTDMVPTEAWWGVSTPEMSNAMIWAVWVLPLIGYELLLQYRGR